MIRYYIQWSWSCAVVPLYYFGGGGGGIVRQSKVLLVFLPRMTDSGFIIFCIHAWINVHQAGCVNCLFTRMVGHLFSQVWLRCVYMGACWCSVACAAFVAFDFVTCTHCVFGCFVQIYLLFCVDISVDWYFLRQRLADKVIFGIWSKFCVCVKLFLVFDQSCVCVCVCAIYNRHGITW